jgi:hypothetical protein
MLLAVRVSKKSEALENESICESPTPYLALMLVEQSFDLLGDEDQSKEP